MARGLVITDRASGFCIWSQTDRPKSAQVREAVGLKVKDTSPGPSQRNVVPAAERRAAEI